MKKKTVSSEEPTSAPLFGRAAQPALELTRDFPTDRVFPVAVGGRPPRCLARPRGSRTRRPREVERWLNRQESLGKPVRAHHDVLATAGATVRRGGRDDAKVAAPNALTSRVTFAPTPSGTPGRPSSAGASPTASGASARRSSVSAVSVPGSRAIASRQSRSFTRACEAGRARMGIDPATNQPNRAFYGGFAGARSANAECFDAPHDPAARARCARRSRRRARKRRRARPGRGTRSPGLRGRRKSRRQKRSVTQMVANERASNRRRGRSTRRSPPPPRGFRAPRPTRRRNGAASSTPRARRGCITATFSPTKARGAWTPGCVTRRPMRLSRYSRRCAPCTRARRAKGAGRRARRRRTSGRASCPPRRIRAAAARRRGARNARARASRGPRGDARG